jgi:intein-encoded DNA endonuclease-like protein
LADYLNLNKSTIGRYLKSGKLLLAARGKYYIRATIKNEETRPAEPKEERE